MNRFKMAFILVSLVLSNIAFAAAWEDYGTLTISASRGTVVYLFTPFYKNPMKKSLQLDISRISAADKAKLQDGVMYTIEGVSSASQSGMIQVTKDRSE